jgi:hypothetical protein
MIVMDQNSDYANNAEIWLLGQPLLNDYLHFVERWLLDSVAFDRSQWVAEWCAANDYYEALAKTEAGIADTVKCKVLPLECKILAEAIQADSRYQHTFNTVPSRFGLVELDKLVVYQYQVAWNHIVALKQRLPANPSTVDLFHFCLSLQPPTAPVQCQTLGSKRYVFQSESTDFQFQDAVLLTPGQMDYQNFGPIHKAVALLVGFGSNFLNVIEDDDSKRLLLHNGYHRACALHALGIRYAPCIIQTVSRRDELDICAPSDVAKSPGYYFNAPRPPLLKDFFDPNIRKVLPIKQRVKMVEINFDVQEFWVSG